MMPPQTCHPLHHDTASVQEIEEAKGSIEQMLGALDRRKAACLKRTFADISKAFAEAFAALVPGGSGRLSWEHDEESGEYVGVRVRFV